MHYFKFQNHSTDQSQISLTNPTPKNTPIQNKITDTNKTYNNTNPKLPRVEITKIPRVIAAPPPMSTHQQARRSPRMHKNTTVPSPIRAAYNIPTAKSQNINTSTKSTPHLSPDELLVFFQRDQISLFKNIDVR